MHMSYHTRLGNVAQALNRIFEGIPSDRGAPNFQAHDLLLMRPIKRRGRSGGF